MTNPKHKRLSASSQTKLSSGLSTPKTPVDSAFNKGTISSDNKKHVLHRPNPLNGTPFSSRITERTFKLLDFNTLSDKSPVPKIVDSALNSLRKCREQQNTVFKYNNPHLNARFPPSIKSSLIIEKPASPIINKDLDGELAVDLHDWCVVLLEDKLMIKGIVPTKLNEPSQKQNTILNQRDYIGEVTGVIDIRTILTKDCTKKIRLINSPKPIPNSEVQNIFQSGFPKNYLELVEDFIEKRKKATSESKKEFSHEENRNAQLFCPTNPTYAQNNNQKQSSLSLDRIDALSNMNKSVISKGSRKFKEVDINKSADSFSFKGIPSSSNCKQSSPKQKNITEKNISNEIHQKTPVKKSKTVAVTRSGRRVVPPKAYWKSSTRNKANTSRDIICKEESLKIKVKWGTGDIEIIKNNKNPV